MKKITVLLEIILLVALPLLAVADILWQDDFDGYYPGMPLEDSPDWDEFYPPDYATFEVATQSGDDLWVGANISTCIATGGADNPNMKVSAGEVDIGVAHLGLLGVLTRYSISEENGYAAVCKVYNMDDPPTFYGEIYYIDDDDYLHDELASIELPGAISFISIVAHGENPVYLEAWFDGYCLTTYDYIYNLTEGYGGIFAEG